MNTIISSPSSIDVANLLKDLAQINLQYLAISVAILTVLGGVFVYFNLNPIRDSLNKQEKKIDNLKEEANDLLVKSEDQLKKILKDFKEEESRSLSTFLLEQSKKITLEFENEIKNSKIFLLEKIENITEDKDIKLQERILSEVTNSLGALDKALNLLINKSKEDLNKQIVENGKLVDSLKIKIKDIARAVKELEIDKFNREGKMGAIIYSIELLKGDIDEKSWRIPTSLVNLKEKIKDFDLDPDYITDIEEQLIRLEEDKKYNVLVKAIRDLYKK